MSMILNHYDKVNGNEISEAIKDHDNMYLLAFFEWVEKCSEEDSLDLTFPSNFKNL